MHVLKGLACRACHSGKPSCSLLFDAVLRYNAVYVYIRYTSVTHKGAPRARSEGGNSPLASLRGAPSVPSTCLLDAHWAPASSRFRYPGIMLTYPCVHLRGAETLVFANCDNSVRSRTGIAARESLRRDRPGGLACAHVHFGRLVDSAPLLTACVSAVLGDRVRGAAIRDDGHRTSVPG